MDYLNAFSPINPALIMAFFIWSLFWRILALWRAAKNEQKYWFIGLLLINSLGILEIIYLFFFCKKKLTFEDIKKLNFLP